MKGRKRLVCFILILVPLLVSCTSWTIPSSSSEIESATTQRKTEPGTESPIIALPVSPVISDKRISVYRNGLSHCFTLSETGIYCVAYEKNGTFALYCDSQSDEFVKLCSRVDCPHSDETCDAYLDSSRPYLGYYKGKLYYIKPGRLQIKTSENGKKYYEKTPAELWQMDRDGRNKKGVTYCWEKEENVTGYGAVSFTNGIVEGRFRKVEDDGTVVYSRRYTSLDHPDIFTETAGSEQLPSVEENSNGSILGSDGDKIIIQDNSQKKNPNTDDGKTYLSLYTWDPVENSIDYIGDRPFMAGYFGTETAFVVEEGILKQWNYQTYTGTALFDTGIKTNLSLYTFPDCFALCDTYEYGMLEDGVIPEIVIRFYDWDYGFLGECKLSFSKEQTRYGNYFFGETEDRLLIVKNSASSRPDYYIEKSDLGRGEITLHEYRYPEMDVRE